MHAYINTYIYTHTLTPSHSHTPAHTPHTYTQIYIYIYIISDVFPNLLSGVKSFLVHFEVNMFHQLRTKSKPSSCGLSSSQPPKSKTPYSTNFQWVSRQRKFADLKYFIDIINIIITHADWLNEERFTLASRKCGRAKERGRQCERERERERWINGSMDWCIVGVVFRWSCV
jgi:hypothetical protein